MKRILFEDDFEGTELKPTWRHRGSQTEPNSIGSVTSLRSVSVHDGAVHLRSVPVTGGFHHASIGTGEVGQPCDFTISHGYVEAKVKFNSYHGGHGAVWLMAATDYELGQAEIDIGEYNGTHNPSRKSGSKVYQNVYTRLAGQGINEFASFKFSFSSLDFKRWDTWNRFKVHLEEDRFTFYINGHKTVIHEGVYPVMPKFLCISMLTKYQIEVEAMGHNHDLPEMSVDWIRAWDFISG